MHFEIVGEITRVETIATGSAIRGLARVRLADGTVLLAEVRWYEAHGIGRKELKIKRYLD